MKTLIVILALFIATTASAKDKWTTKNTILQSTFAAVTVIDWAQTLHAARNPDKFTETNPILGSHPSKGRVNAYFPLYIASHTYIATKIDEPYRTLWQSFYIIWEVDAVNNNRTQGIGFSLSF